MSKRSFFSSTKRLAKPYALTLAVRLFPPSLDDCKRLIVGGKCSFCLWLSRICMIFFFIFLKWNTDETLFYLISPNTHPAFSVTNTMLLSGPPTTCTAPLLMMYISLPMSPCREDQMNKNETKIINQTEAKTLYWCRLSKPLQTVPVLTFFTTKSPGR